MDPPGASDRLPRLRGQPLAGRNRRARPGGKANPADRLLGNLRLLGGGGQRAHLGAAAGFSSPLARTGRRSSLPRVRPARGATPPGRLDPGGAGDRYQCESRLPAALPEPLGRRGDQRTHRHRRRLLPERRRGSPLPEIGSARHLPQLPIAQQPHRPQPDRADRSHRLVRCRPERGSARGRLRSPPARLPVRDDLSGVVGVLPVADGIPLGGRVRRLVSGFPSLAPAVRQRGARLLAGVHPDSAGLGGVARRPAPRHLAPLGGLRGRPVRAALGLPGGDLSASPHQPARPGRHPHPTPRRSSRSAGSALVHREPLRRNAVGAADGGKRRPADRMAGAEGGSRPRDQVDQDDSGLLPLRNAVDASTARRRSRLPGARRSRGANALALLRSRRRHRRAPPARNPAAAPGGGIPPLGLALAPASGSAHLVRRLPARPSHAQLVSGLRPPVVRGAGRAGSHVCVSSDPIPGALGGAHRRPLRRLSRGPGELDSGAPDRPAHAFGPAVPGVGPAHPRHPRSLRPGPGRGPYGFLLRPTRLLRPSGPHRRNQGGAPGLAGAVRP